MLKTNTFAGIHSHGVGVVVECLRLFPPIKEAARLLFFDFNPIPPNLHRNSNGSPGIKFLCYNNRFCPILNQNTFDFKEQSAPLRPATKKTVF
jgi:hypothetical protein